MDALKLGRRHLAVLVTPVKLNLVGYLQLFQEPEYPLRAGLVQVMNRDHRRPVIRAFIAPASRQLVPDASNAGITPGYPTDMPGNRFLGCFEPSLIRTGQPQGQPRSDERREGKKC